MERNCQTNGHLFMSAHRCIMCGAPEPKPADDFPADSDLRLPPDMELALSALPDCGARDMVRVLIAKRIRDLKVALLEAERGLSIYARLPTNEYPGPPITALKVVRAALDREGEHE